MASAAGCVPVGSAARPFCDPAWRPWCDPACWMRPSGRPGGRSGLPASRSTAPDRSRIRRATRVAMAAMATLYRLRPIHLRVAAEQIALRALRLTWLRMRRCHGSNAACDPDAGPALRLIHVRALRPCRVLMCKPTGPCTTQQPNSSGQADHQPASTSLPIVLPLSRRRCASRKCCALIGDSVSVWVVRNSPASIRLAARLRMRCCSTMSSVA